MLKLRPPAAQGFGQLHDQPSKATGPWLRPNEQKQALRRAFIVVLLVAGGASCRCLGTSFALGHLDRFKDEAMTCPILSWMPHVSKTSLLNLTAHRSSSLLPNFAKGNMFRLTVRTLPVQMRWRLKLLCQKWTLNLIPPVDAESVSPSIPRGRQPLDD